MHKFEIKTNRRDQMVDITDKVIEVIGQEKVQEGTVIIYCPHTTAGITINENADPDVGNDLLMRLNEVFPWEHTEYRHTEGNSAAHLKASTVGASQTLLISRGKLILGTWQGIYFCEFDGPRKRTFYIKVQED